MRLLVGFGGSDGARDALELARVLATVSEASVLVVAVLPYGPLPVPYEMLEEEEAERAQPLFEEARELLGAGIAVETRAFGGGSPAGVINDLAEREEVETIVVGSPHRGAVGRVLIGSVADGLLHGAPCEVVAAPRGYADERHGPFRKIAAAYDDTPEAKAALARAEALARASRAQIVVYTVSAPAVVPGASGYTPALPPEAGEIVTRTVKRVDEALAATGRELAGVPGLALAAACEADGVDLVVAGSRGYGPVLRVLLGSVSTQLMHRAPCPVLVVPRPREEGSGG